MSLVYSRLLGDPIDFSVIGSAANQAQAEYIIACNDGNGIFVLNTDRHASMQQITDYR